MQWECARRGCLTTSKTMSSFRGQRPAPFFPLAFMFENKGFLGRWSRWWSGGGAGWWISESRWHHVEVVEGVEKVDDKEEGSDG